MRKVDKVEYIICFRSNSIADEPNVQSKLTYLQKLTQVCGTLKECGIDHRIQAKGESLFKVLQTVTFQPPVKVDSPITQGTARIIQHPFICTTLVFTYDFLPIT